MNNKLGRRLKYFRERARKSQFKLEVEIEASSGTISRIEQGKVNPTKETVRSIAKVLEMNEKELDYVIGVTSDVASNEDIQKAREEVRDYFDTKVFAYLIDERWRLCGITDHFRKSLGVSEDYIQKVLGNATIQFVIDPDLGIVNLFPKDHFYEILDNNLRYYYKEVGFMNDDETFQNAVHSIRKNKMASEIWDTINYERDIKYSFRFGRRVHFRLFNKIDVPFTYSYESLLTNSRFKVVEYTPENKFIEIISKFI